MDWIWSYLPTDTSERDRLVYIALVSACLRQTGIGVVFDPVTEVATRTGLGSRAIKQSLRRLAGRGMLIACPNTNAVALVAWPQFWPFVSREDVTEEPIFCSAWTCPVLLWVKEEWPSDKQPKWLREAEIGCTFEGMPVEHVAVVSQSNVGLLRNANSKTGASATVCANGAVPAKCGDGASAADSLARALEEKEKNAFEQGKAREVDEQTPLCSVFPVLNEKKQGRAEETAQEDEGISQVDGLDIGRGGLKTDQLPEHAESPSQFPERVEFDQEQPILPSNMPSPSQRPIDSLVKEIKEFTEEEGCPENGKCGDCAAASSRAEQADAPEAQIWPENASGGEEGSEAAGNENIATAQKPGGSPGKSDGSPTQEKGSSSSVEDEPMADRRREQRFLADDELKRIVRQALGLPTDDEDEPDLGSNVDEKKSPEACLKKDIPSIGKHNKAGEVMHRVMHTPCTANAQGVNNDANTQCTAPRDAQILRRRRSEESDDSEDLFAKRSQRGRNQAGLRVNQTQFAFPDGEEPAGGAGSGHARAEEIARELDATIAAASSEKRPLTLAEIRQRLAPQPHTYSPPAALPQTQTKQLETALRRFLQALQTENVPPLSSPVEIVARRLLAEIIRAKQDTAPKPTASTHSPTPPSVIRALKAQERLGFCPKSLLLPALSNLITAHSYPETDQTNDPSKTLKPILENTRGIPIKLDVTPLPGSPLFQDPELLEQAIKISANAEETTTQKAEKDNRRGSLSKERRPLSRDLPEEDLSSGKEREAASALEVESSSGRNPEFGSARSSDGVGWNSCSSEGIASDGGAGCSGCGPSEEITPVLGRCLFEALSSLGFSRLSRWELTWLVGEFLRIYLARVCARARA